MNSLNLKHQLIAAFTQLRPRLQVPVGISELLTIARLAEQESSHDELEAAARALWCVSEDDRLEFDALWASVFAPPDDQPDRESRHHAPPTSWPIESPDSTRLSQGAQPAPMETRSAPEWTALPVAAPTTPTGSTPAIDLSSYWPVSRRAMVYAWRYLRRPVADGPPDVLDLEATVEHAARSGFYLTPVYRRRERNHAHLLLLIDQGGSMTPLHRFSRDLAETATNESTLERVDVAYFHNVPGEYVYQDPHLTQPIEWAQVLARCDRETSVLIVSDAGAARQSRRLMRIQATTEALFALRCHTPLLVWLNPLPRERWVGTSAEIIARRILMKPMDREGLHQAIHAARGQPCHHVR